ncbi:MAG: integrin alpha, partial [Pseudomonadota bacterium]
MAFGAVFELSSLNGTNGYTLTGVSAGDFAGFSVSGAGDVNNDGIDDLIIGAYLADPSGGSDAGETYVVFGTAANTGATVDLSALDGSDGFRLDGGGSGDRSGYSVSDAGDVNGDGFDDIIIGAYRADPGSQTDAGDSYVVFGSGSGFSASLDLDALNGSDGFALSGVDAGDEAGWSVASAGDVNGDGFDDVIVGAPGADNDAGESFVVFGRSTAFPARIDLGSLNGNNGFRIDGIDTDDRSGLSVSGAGDINGD